MNDQALEPRNDLERHMLAAQEGSLPIDQFMRGLLHAQVFMPVRDSVGIEGFQESPRAQPLSLQEEDGTQVLILFSSPDRARPFVKDFPGFEGGVLEDLKWVLQRMGGGYGIAINPGWAVGVDLDPDTVLRLAHQAAAETTD